MSLGHDRRVVAYRKLHIVIIETRGMAFFEFAGECVVEIRDRTSSPLGTELVQYYSKLQTNTANPADISCSIRPVDPDPDRILGDPDTYFGRQDDRFIDKRYGGVMVIEDDLDTIVCSPEAEPYFVKKYLEFRVRERVAEDGITLIHASGFRHDGEVTLLPAWRHTGKTNTLIPFLQDGGDYLSDDRVWVSSAGDVRGFPVPVNMLPYNYDSYPGLMNPTTAEKVRNRTSELLSEWIVPQRSLPDKALHFFNMYYLEPDGEYRFIEEMIPSASYIDSASVDELVFLQTTSGDTVSIESLSETAAVELLRAISHYEWNTDMQELMNAYDALFPDSNKMERLESLIKKEEDIFESLVDLVDIRMMKLPREEDWNEKDVTVQVRKSLRKKDM